MVLWPQMVDAVAPLPDRVRSVLLESLPSGDASIRSVSKQLGMSTRTLQRRLGEEGAAYRQIVRETRLELARHYLRNTTLSYGEISLLVGFDDASSFFRAFREWTGSTPEAWRTVSRQHARLYRNAGKWMIEDLGSNNGTFINGESVQAVALSDEDEITIAQNRIRVEMPKAKDGTGEFDANVTIVDIANPALYMSSADPDSASQSGIYSLPLPGTDPELESLYMSGVAPTYFSSEIEP